MDHEPGVGADPPAGTWRGSEACCDGKQGCLGARVGRCSQQGFGDFDRTYSKCDKRAVGRTGSIRTYIKIELNMYVCARTHVRGCSDDFGSHSLLHVRETHMLYLRFCKFL